MNELTTKKEITIPSWLKGWHSDYQTCLEVWQELKDKAQAHHLSLSQIGEIEGMMEKYAMLHREIAQLEKENRGTPMKLYNEEPIQEVWKMEDDDDEIIVARKGDCYYDILYWTIK